MGSSMLYSPPEQLAHEMTPYRLTYVILIRVTEPIDLTFVTLYRTRFETLARRLVLAYAGSSIVIVQGTVICVCASKDGTEIVSMTLRPTIINESTATSLQT